MQTIWTCCDISHLTFVSLYCNTLKTSVYLNLRLSSVVRSLIRITCRSQLYAAYIIPPQPPTPAPKKGQPPPETGILVIGTHTHARSDVTIPLPVSEVPVVSRVSVLAGDRERLLQLVDTSKQLQAQQLLQSLGATAVGQPISIES